MKMNKSCARAAAETSTEMFEDKHIKKKSSENCEKKLP